MTEEKQPDYNEFLGLYLKHLSAPDRPTNFIAYCRAESDVIIQYGARRYANNKVWRNTMSRNYNRIRTIKPSTK